MKESDVVGEEDDGNGFFPFIKQVFLLSLCQIFICCFYALDSLSFFFSKTFEETEK